MGDVPAHAAKQGHAYVVHFPAHPARETDPHYVDFTHYHKLHRLAARCYVGDRVGYQDCRDSHGQLCPPQSNGFQPALELHHAHVEFSLQNGISLTALEKDFPGISDKTNVGAWVESDVNFRWLCCFHHRGPGGAHTASHSDWTASNYIPGLISK